MVGFVAGCLDQAIDKTQKGEDIPADLQSIVDSVLRSSSGENAKLVRLNLVSASDSF